MGQYLLIPFLVGWTSIYQLFWCELQGYYWFWHTAIWSMWIQTTWCPMVGPTTWQFRCWIPESELTVTDVFGGKARARTSLCWDFYFWMFWGVLYMYDHNESLYSSYINVLRCFHRFPVCKSSNTTQFVNIWWCSWIARWNSKVCEAGAQTSGRRRSRFWLERKLGEGAWPIGP